MSKPTIAFISQLPKKEQSAWLVSLAELLPDENIVLASDFTEDQKKHCRIAIIANPDPEVVLQFTQLVWCQSLWAGVDSLVNAFKFDQSVTFKISRLIDPRLAQTMSEAVLTWVLYLHRDMHKYLAQQKQVQWHQIDYQLPEERTIGVLGLGELGKACTARLKDNGFNVLGWSRNEKHLSGIQCFSGKQGLVDFARKTDILICLLPLTQDTQQLINHEFLHCLPKGACLINFARGAVIVDDDLLHCLDNGQLAYAVLDVFEQEPLSRHSLYWQHDKVTVLPHISAPTHVISASKVVASHIEKFRATGQLPPCIDFDLGY